MAEGAVGGDEPAGVVEVVLDDGAAVPGDHGLQLVGIDEPAAARPDDLGRVVVERLQWLARRLAHGADDA